MSPQFWLGLQMDYDLDVEEDRLAQRLVREVRLPHKLINILANETGFESSLDGLAFYCRTRGSCMWIREGEGEVVRKAARHLAFLKPGTNACNHFRNFVCSLR